MRIIDDEYAPDAPAKIGGRDEYARSKSDPTVLMSCRTGDCFTRRDGAKWEWPGYRIERETEHRVTREPATGFEDLARYKPDGVAVTVGHIERKKPAA